VKKKKEKRKIVLFNFDLII